MLLQPLEHLMPTKAEAIVESFPHLSLLQIEGIPSFASINKLQIKLNAYVASVQLDLGDSNLGLLYLKDLQNILNEAYAQIHSLCIQNQPTSKSKKPLSERHYCWTHGFKVKKDRSHTSKICTGRREGHKEEASAIDKLGGSIAGMWHLMEDNLVNTKKHHKLCNNTYSIYDTILTSDSNNPLLPQVAIVDT